MAQVRVRFAPSPTGSLHVGGARTALFNWLFARHHGGRMVLRIEDTDRSRSREESARGILEGMRWLELDWDEGPERGGDYGPYYQSQRLPVYREYLHRLEEAGAVYPCYCTPEELAARREEARRAGRPPRYDGRCRALSRQERSDREGRGIEPVLRLRVPAAGATVVDDLIRGSVSFENAVLDDFILWKSDGMPTYNFACVVDDAAMRISHVVRAEEHLSNTPKQLLLYVALGEEPPRFAHVPMILAPDRSKLSKRHGATSLEEFRQQGFLPQAMVNYLALLGWSPDGVTEKMDRGFMVAHFDLGRVTHNAAVYDVQKLTWLNAIYLREMAVAALARAVTPFLRRAGLIPEELAGPQQEYLERVVGLLRERAHTLEELAALADYFFRPVEGYDEKGVRKHFRGEGAAELLAAVRERLAGAEEFTAAALEAAFSDLAAARGVPRGALIHPVRLAVTGRTMGPGLFELLELLGRERVLDRMARAQRWLEENVV
ncbi:MAG: glutamate--tRNA ligase [Thermaerobacter sp.]|nr:glutamate--tRNA ligase [Thermaerobacter sp.]